MIRAFALIACLIPATAFAQSNSEPPAVMGTGHHMMHGQHMMSPGQRMQHEQMMQGPATGGRSRHSARARRVRRDSGDRRNSRR